jgi:uncharacterized protein Usg
MTATTGKKLILPEQLTAEQIRSALSTLRTSWEIAQRRMKSGSWGEVTANIRYIVPSGRLVRTNTFVYQVTDVLPVCPLLDGFLTFWDENVDGQIFDLKVTGIPQVKFDELTAAHVRGIN